MIRGKAYGPRFFPASASRLAPFLLIAAGAIIVALLGFAIGKVVSVDSDFAQDAKAGGVRHDAAMLASDESGQMAVEGQEGSAGTVMHNGITVVSPQLLVPVIDLDLRQGANDSDAGVSSSQGSKASKRSRYAKRSRWGHQTSKRWAAYGLAIR